MPGHRNRIAALIVLAVALAIAGAACAAERPIGWDAGFGNPDALVNTITDYENGASKKPMEPVVVKELVGGNLRFGLRFDPQRTRDRLTLAWGNTIRLLAAGPFEPVDLARYPVIEMKWRGGRFDAIFYGFEIKSGEKRVDYVNVSVTRTEKDEAGGADWNVSAMRIAGDIANPTAATPVKLIGISISSVSPATQDGVSEVKYLRVAGLTPEEAAAESKVVESLRNFPQERWRGFDTFFPYGVYGNLSLRGMFDSWAGDYEGAYFDYSRRHINYIAYNEEVAIGWFNGVKTDAGFAAYVAAQQQLIDSAKAAGIKLSSGLLFSILDGTDLTGGYKSLLPITQKLVKAFPTDDTLIAWGLNAELTADSLVKHVYLMRALRESDPLHRPELVVFNDPCIYRSFADYMSLGFWDHYPIVQGSRKPWTVRDIARAYRTIQPNKPQWAVLPSFEMRPPAEPGTYLRPSDAEMRLMAYSAVAEGAKGIIWFCGYVGEGSFEGLVDRAGSPRGGMLDTIADLGRGLIPAGKQLLATEPADLKLVVTQSEKLTGDKGVTASVLKVRNKPVYYVVVINEDLDNVRGANVALPKEMAAKDIAGYDLYCRTWTKLDKYGQIGIANLAGGDGRIYVVGSRAECRTAASRMACDTALEDIRSLSPDLSLARRWRLNIAAAEAAVKRCKELGAAGKGAQAQKAADEARQRLKQETESDSVFNGISRALSDMRIELSEVSRITEYRSANPKWWTGSAHPMLVPNPGFLDVSKRYFEVGRTYSQLYARFLKGDREGLWVDVAKARLDCLRMREDVLALVRDRLKPSVEPQAQ